jgi:hypothetical protein
VLAFFSFLKAGHFTASYGFKARDHCELEAFSIPVTHNLQPRLLNQTIVVVVATTSNNSSGGSSCHHVKQQDVDDVAVSCVVGKGRGGECYPYEASLASYGVCVSW